MNLKQNLKLIVGLGNPGLKYEQTRHNIGFLGVDCLAAYWHIPVKKVKYQALWGVGQVGRQKVILLKPQTYMNLSGQAVKGFMQAYYLSPSDLLVIYDDLDLPVGHLRLKVQGGAGGHRGVQSIIQLLGTEQFHRVKIGIGRPPTKEATVNYVLQRISNADLELISPTLNQIPEVVETWINQGILAAMNKFN